MAAPGSTLTAEKESLGRRVYHAVHDRLHYIAEGMGRITEPIYKAAVDVKESALHLIHHPPENPGAFSTAPPYQEQANMLNPIERTDEYEKAHPFAPYALSKRDKNTILQKDNGIISSQLDMRSLNTVRIFTGIEMYNLSVRLDTDTSMYNTSPIRDREEEVFINSSPEVVKKAPEIIMTLTDFNHKYLKWMDGEVTDTPDNIKKRKRDLKNLFKFVFNNSKLNDLTTSFVKKLQRIAHTPLDTEDKLPCQGSPLYEDFKRSLEYRMAEAVKEMEVARATFGEMNSYTQQKTILYDGINDLVRLMQGGYTRGCIKYQYGNKSDYRVVMDLAEQNRIMRLFIQFIKKQEPGYMNSGTLQERLKDKDKYRVLDSDGREGRFNELYNELTGILESMRTPSSSEEIESLKEQLKEKDLAILALESLLQISIQITHLNEGSLELEERYQRVETKMESEKLFQQYEKFRGLLGGLRLNASMQELINCGEQLAGIMIQYSGRKDISSDERDDATERLIDVNRVLYTYKNKMDYNTVYNGLSGLYDDIGIMIEKKYMASASSGLPSAPVAPLPATAPSPLTTPAPPAGQQVPALAAQAQAPCTFFNNTQVIPRPLTEADNILLGSSDYKAIDTWVNTKVNELSLQGTRSTEDKNTTIRSIIRPDEYDETLPFSTFERMVSSGNNQDCLIHSLLTSLSRAFRQLNKTGKDCIATYFRLYIMVPIVERSTTVSEADKNQYVTALNAQYSDLDVNLAAIFGDKFNISIFVKDRVQFGWLYLAKAPKELPDREVIVIYNPGAGHFEAVRDSSNNQYIFQYNLVESWDKKKNTMGMTENQAKCKFTYSGAHLRLKSKTAKKFKVLFSENTADQKACKHVYILPEEHYGKIKDIEEKIRQVSFVMGYYEDVTKGMVSENKKSAFQNSTQWIEVLFPGKKLEDLSFADIPELINITNTQDLYEYDPTKYEEQPADYKKSVTAELNFPQAEKLAAEAPAAQAQAQAPIILPKNDPEGNIQRSSGKQIEQKDALNKLKIPITPVEKSKTIGDYTFTPVYYKSGDRITIYYHSNTKGGPKTNYKGYRSNSACGLWHFKLNDFGTIDKGIDYVQSTLLHPELQGYFTNWVLLNKPSESPPEEWCDEKTYNVEFQYLYDKHRILNNLTPVPDDISLFKSYNDKDENKCGSQLNKYKSLVKLSEDLDNKFKDKLEEPILICKNYIFDYPKGTERIHIVGDIYSVKFNTIILYYLQYKMDIYVTNIDIRRIGDDFTKYMPILLTTKGNTISEQGLNTLYITAGDYICKLFDYFGKKQTPFFIQGYKEQIGRNAYFNPKNYLPHQNFHKPISILQTYFYIGFKYDYLFPYVNIRDKIKAVPAAKQQFLKGGGKPTPQQKLQAIFDIESNSDTKNYCDTVLTLLLIDMKRKMYDFDANKFMKKLGTSLGKTKPCPVVFHILKIILDEGMKQVIDSNAYIFSPQKSLNYTEDTFQNLEQRYAETFDDSEKEAFENMTPIRYYHRTPEEFRDLLGDSPYILSGHSDDTEPELRGVDVDGLYDEPLRMTADEKNLLTCGGIPMGAIIFMYITAVANNKRSDILKSLQSDPLLE